MELFENEIKKDIADVLGLNDEDGTYIYSLTRVKDAFANGTMTLDDFVEVDEELVEDIYEAIKPYIEAKQVVINTPPLPESELVKSLYNNINQLQLEIFNLHSEQFNKYKQYLGRGDI